MRIAHLLLRYLRAWDQALRWCHDEKNRDEAIRLIAEAEKIDEKAAANRLRQSPRAWPIESARASERARFARAIRAHAADGERFGKVL